MSTDELSGIDLARVALTAAKERAKQLGTRSGPATRKPARRSGTGRRDGRDPMALGSALGRLMTERGWERPAAGGSVLSSWEQIAGGDGSDLVNHVRAVSFDEATGQLDLAADSTAWATQTRLLGPQLVQRANQFLQRNRQPGQPAGQGEGELQVVRSIMVKLQEAGPGAARRPQDASIRSEPPQPPAKPYVRAEPPAGYRQAKALLAANKLQQHGDRDLAEAAERLAGSRRFREPDQVFADLMERHRPTGRPSPGAGTLPERTDTPR
ncbi:DciA family protein [Streptomyces sp. NBC_01264]|uniref:DciA family protein n=1 Tax=Streptomyces sp. NBC_01264 TaxID=2903804 RepID=UPI00225981BA|nr:DciA family protein [Streptomyces sp. NBC_01264]MCX4783948.1 DciA family protein [Streptomyces sp. NBC_01264]